MLAYGQPTLSAHALSLPPLWQQSSWAILSLTGMSAAWGQAWNRSEWALMWVPGGDTLWPCRPYL